MRALRAGLVAGLLVAIAQAAFPNSTSFAGTTHAAQIPALALPGQGTLIGVSCTSSSACWAAGYTGTGMEMLRWDGQAWAVVPSPIAGGDTSISSSNVQLSGLTCSGRSSCWAVGVRGAGSTGSTDLILHWNGQAWSVVLAPNPKNYDPNGQRSGNLSLASVACASAANCWAVGHYGANLGPHRGALLNQILHWNGTTWSVAPAPNPGHVDTTYSGALLSVACAGPRACWAVGFYWSTARPGLSRRQRNQLLGWNGVRWAVVHAPHPQGALFDGLTSMTCASRTSCLAVGRWTGKNVIGSQALSWNGKTWALTSTQTMGDLWGNSFAVSCSSATDCWVMGQSGGGG